MNTFLKTAAAASLMATLAAPAFAAAHIDASTMNCAEFNELEAADQAKVAEMALSEIGEGGDEGRAELLMRTCERSLDATVTEAASGQAGTD